MEFYVPIKEEADLDHQKPMCHACLSRERVVYVLTNSYKSLYHFISQFEENSCSLPVTFPIQVYLCWECLALLNKVKLFQKKVRNAQDILRRNLDQKPLQCQSSLAIVKLKGTDSNESISSSTIQIKSEEDLERYNESDFGDFGSDFDDDEKPSSGVEVDPGIKCEEVPPDLTRVEVFPKTPVLDQLLTTEYKNETKTVKENKGKRPKIKHYKKIGTPKGVKTKRIAIKPQDIDSWMERERDSEYFKNLRRKCNVCLDALGEKETLKEHKRRFHVNSESTPYTCDICKKNFCTKNNLVVHIVKHYFGRQCLHCDYRCYTRSNMKEHIRRHRRTVECLECGANFMHVRLFFKHYKSSHVYVACDLCGRKFKSKDALARHIPKSHSSTHCSICNFTFKNKASYKLHMGMKHTVDKSESCFCVMCDIQFDNILLFRQHVNNAAAHAHERGGKPKKERIPCPECPSTYAKKYNMLNHYRFVHANDSRFVCVECNKSFLSRTTFVAHRRRYHEGYVPEKNKLCTICGRKFTNNRTLIHHIRTHTGEKPHECSFCDAKFAQKTAMTTHIKSVHFNVRRK